LCFYWYFEFTPVVSRLAPDSRYLIILKILKILNIDREVYDHIIHLSLLHLFRLEQHRMMTIMSFHVKAIAKSIPKLVRSTGKRMTCRAFSIESSSTVDTLIVGGGPVGSSTAYHLSKLRNSGEGITVLELDPSYGSSSAMRSAGGIRQQFSLEENVRMSLYGRDFLRNAHTLLATSAQPIVDVHFAEHGYLFLTSTASGVKQMKENHQVQRTAGCTSTQLLSPKHLKDLFPWLNVDDILLGSYGSNGEGWFDPWAYIQGLREKNKESGVVYLRATVVGTTRDPDSGRILLARVQDQATGQTQTIQFQNLVNATGAHADALMTLLAGDDEPLEYPIPVKPRKRCIFFFHCSSSQDEIVPYIAPLTVDPSLVYFRSEGKPGSGKFICGVSPPCDQDVDCWDPQELEHADHSLFEECIWPALYHRVPAFGNIKVVSSWAGLYEYNTVDQNAIIDFHPELENVLMVNGFSGHGLQHSPAAGRAAAELLENSNEFLTLDLNKFRFDRFLDGGSPIYEKGIV
jgi:FAD-dependent oxidoreductase domain-containing protein 1